jgi:hypothetical protein
MSRAISSKPERYNAGKSRKTGPINPLMSAD